MRYVVSRREALRIEPLTFDESSAANAVVTGGSAFNIKACSLRLGDFSRDEMQALPAQHTEETGQAFT